MASERYPAPAFWRSCADPGDSAPHPTITKRVPCAVKISGRIWGQVVREIPHMR